MLTRPLHVKHLALAITDDLIGRFDLVQKRLYFGECLTPGRILRIGVNDPSRRRKFVSKFAGKKRVILSRLGDNFAIWLRSVQGAEPTFKRKAPSQPELMQPCHRLG